MSDHVTLNSRQADMSDHVTLNTKSSVQVLMNIPFLFQLLGNPAPRERRPPLITVFVVLESRFKALAKPTCHTHL